MDSRACVVVALVCVFAVGSLGSSQIQLLGEDRVTVEQHTEIKLVCRVPTDTTQVIWKRGSVTINADPTKKITTAFSEAKESSTTRDYVLEIAEAEESDTGSYSCFVNNEQSDKTVHVTVTESEFSMLATKNRVTLIPGSSLTLACKADIHTHVEWRKGSTTFSNVTSEVAISESIDSDNAHLKTSRLTFSHATESHAGNYVCQNEHHTDDKDEIIVSQMSETSGKSPASEVSALLFGSVLVLALLR